MSFVPAPRTSQALSASLGPGTIPQAIRDENLVNAIQVSQKRTEAINYERIVKRTRRESSDATAADLENAESFRIGSEVAVLMPAIQRNLLPITVDELTKYFGQ